MTARHAPDCPGEWLTVEQAAAYLGLSPSGFRGLAESEGFDVRRRGSRPGVRRSVLDDYIDRARIRPGDVTGTSLSTGRYEAHEPYARTLDSYVPGLAEVGALHGRGWTDADIAHALGIHFSNVSRRRVNGFSPSQVLAMRGMIARTLNDCAVSEVVRFNSLRHYEVQETTLPFCSSMCNA